MTCADIKQSLSYETLWMIAETIRQGCRAVWEAEQEKRRQEERKALGKGINYLAAHTHRKGVSMSAEILGRVFNVSTWSIQNILCEVAEKIEDYTVDEVYFDKFIEIYLKQFSTISLRVFP